MVLTTVKHIDPSSYDEQATEPFKRPWNKVDGPACSYRLRDFERIIENIRGRESEFSLDTSGFAAHRAPAKEKLFATDRDIREGYYTEIEALLCQKLPRVKKVVIFDHTVRRKLEGAPRQPLQLVHIDQTPRAAESRVRRHLPEIDAEGLLSCRYQIINVWRPIQNVASDMPLAVIDARSMESSDFLVVDILYPKDRHQREHDPWTSALSTEGYEAKGEQYIIVPNEKHLFYYVEDMTPDEVLFVKCFDSRSHLMTEGKTDIAHGSGHTAFVDPRTPLDAPARQSIEIRCLVFYEQDDDRSGAEAS